MSLCTQHLRERLKRAQPTDAELAEVAQQMEGVRRLLRRLRRGYYGAYANLIEEQGRVIEWELLRELRGIEPWQEEPLATE
jgi:hypothetical protein